MMDAHTAHTARHLRDVQYLNYGSLYTTSGPMQYYQSYLQAQYHHGTQNSV
jgi:hypothetical protein